MKSETSFRVFFLKQHRKNSLINIFSYEKVYFWISAFDYRAIVLPKMHIVHWCLCSYQGGVQVMCVRSLLPPPEEKIFLISLSLAGLALHNAYIPGGENLYNCLLLGRKQVGVSIKVWCHSQKCEFRE